ncbi:hypothetical protein Sp245p_24010 (plasmid) [Azospirillum baldaniorum]|uniref:Calx-beta domain-containing protein n=1 Tax=Azospirillum baldaniorum TaxID=1064539 RepID=A0A9P1NQZ4_9PROT|nr:hypothetical protein [Azospirillum baldaniorum]AWJ92904.1 hypothetical protein Sp245p_24010 [Azospirillum baldaniorum]TWA76332.1 hypothetical protein FBZ85_109235 [Azospirillum brasilense]CCD02531.1 protein of unknown function [Azospirillum baldaniorum]
MSQSTAAFTISSASDSPLVTVDYIQATWAASTAEVREGSVRFTVSLTLEYLYSYYSSHSGDYFYNGSGPGATFRAKVKPYIGTAQAGDFIFSPDSRITTDAVSVEMLLTVGVENTFTIAVQPDVDYTEGDEIIDFLLDTNLISTGSQSAVQLTTTNSFPTVTIIDAPAPPESPALAITAANGSAWEGHSGTVPLTFTVSRTGDSSTTASARWVVAGSGDNPADAADFGGALPSGFITFAAGETSRTITVNVTGDTAVEPDETFTVTLSDPVGAALGTARVTGTIRNDDIMPQAALPAVIDPARRALVNDGVSGRIVEMAPYDGPVSWLKNQYLGNDLGEAVIGSDRADFMNLLGGNDAAEGWAGDDVLDGGTGSNFLTGGAGKDTFFVDGRTPGITWSTITDFEPGEWATAWGWRTGTSKLTWAEMQGATNFKGSTAHIDMDGNGTIDTSLTFSGKSVGSLMTTTGQIGSDSYIAFILK